MLLVIQLSSSSWIILFQFVDMPFKESCLNRPPFELQVRPSVGPKGRQALDIKIWFHSQYTSWQFPCFRYALNMFEIYVQYVLMPTLSLQIPNLKRSFEEFPCLGMTVIKSKYNILQLPFNEISPFSCRRPQKQDHPWQERHYGFGPTKPGSWAKKFDDVRPLNGCFSKLVLV